MIADILGELYGKPEGESVFLDSSIGGKIINPQDKRTKNGTAYTVFTLDDGQGQIGCKRWGAPSPAIQPNATLFFAPKYVKGQKGYSISAQVYNGKPELNIGEHVGISQGHEVSQATQQQAQQPQQAPAPAATPQSIPFNPTKAENEAKRELVKRANLYGMSMTVVSRSMDLSPEHFQAVSTSLFISMERAGFVGHMPTALPEIKYKAPGQRTIVQTAQEPSSSELAADGFIPEPVDVNADIDDDIPF